jgi:hypothetical protein
MSSTSRRRAAQSALACGVAYVAACATAPATPPRLATASVTVTNPLAEPVKVYQLYQTRAVFEPRLASALCETLGEVAAHDSARFIITAGATDHIGVIFQADSLNGIPAGVSRAMQARAGDELRWTVVTDTRIAAPPRPQRGVTNPPLRPGPVARERNPNRC